MFTHRSVPKINLFSFSTLLCRPIPSRQFPPLSLLSQLPAFTNFEVFLFIVFQVCTILILILFRLSFTVTRNLEDNDM